MVENSKNHAGSLLLMLGSLQTAESRLGGNFGVNYHGAIVCVVHRTAGIVWAESKAMKLSYMQANLLQSTLD